MVKKRFHPFVFIVCLFVLVLAGCQKQDLTSEHLPSPVTGENQVNKGGKKNFPHEVATRWFDEELNLIKESKFNPPLASRALGYIGLTLYESIVPSVPEYQSIQSKLGYGYALPIYKPNTKLYWPAVANAALYRINQLLFANLNSSGSIQTLFNSFYQQHMAAAKKEDIDRSVDYGKAVAEAIFAWSQTDGIQKSYTNYLSSQYTLPVFPGAWVPTSAAPPLLPFWGENRPFLAQNTGDECLPPPVPFAFSFLSGTPFYNMANEVYQKGKTLTDEEKAIADFWNDGAGSITPPGHNMNIATQMIRQHDLGLDEAAMVYAKVGMAQADAFIACWKGKYKYNLLRPVSYIKSYIDGTWTSYIPTPPFPSYGSGHATVSGATAAVLTALFGNNVRFSDRTYENDISKGTRKFNSFNEAADEAAASRFYGGIHFKIDNETGLTKGKLIGSNIANIRLKKP